MVTPLRPDELRKICLPESLTFDGTEDRRDRWQRSWHAVAESSQRSGWKRGPPRVIFTTFHFAEAPANRLTNLALDPIALIPEFKVCAARLERVAGGTGAVPTCCG